MILADTGPLVALFDPQDPYHKNCSLLLEKIKEPLITTAPVLTEAYHLLCPDSQGSMALHAFIEQSGLQVWFMDSAGLKEILVLMKKYVDRPMDFADASLVVAAQYLKTNRIFTVDRNDFFVYRIKVGHELKSFEVVA